MGMPSGAFFSAASSGSQPKASGYADGYLLLIDSASSTGTMAAGGNCAMIAVQQVLIEP